VIIVKGSNRVNRGGSWNNNARNVRVANRNNNNPDNRNNNLGFRLSSTNLHEFFVVQGWRDQKIFVQIIIQHGLDRQK